MPEKRTLNSRTYKTPTGAIMIEQCVRPINYFVDGQLVPIVADLSDEDEDADWAARNQPHPVYVSKNGAYRLTSSSGHPMVFGADASFNEGLNDQAKFEKSGNSILFRDVAPGVDRQIDVRENGVKASFVIRQPMNFQGEFAIAGEEIVLSVGLKLDYDNTRGEMINGIWFGDLIVTNETGEVEARIRSAYCFDQNNQVVRCGYQLEPDDDNSYVLATYIPNAWLNESARAYPVIVDPLVNGPLAAWSGGFIPSCLMPQFSQDSILVTIPGQITVTALLVTGSYYADPFSTAIMADGAMYFSTDCNQTQNFTVAPPNGNLPGTAFLQAFNMSTPLTCCWPQSCQQQQFWLSMHIGRTVGGTGCNLNYVYYDPNTQYPFTAYIEGHTVEYTAVGWTVPNVATCADVCTINGSAYIRYGVPPYTFTHSWMSGQVVAGNAAGCSTGQIIEQLPLAIPNCPQYCDTVTQLQIPPPYVVDMCGNIVYGLPTDIAPRKPVPVITSTPQQQSVCSGEPYTVLNTSCKPNTQITWATIDTSGTFNIIDTYTNNGATDTTINYAIVGVLNGCYSDTVLASVTIDPDPVAAFTYTSPAIAGVPVIITDQSTTGASSVNFWMYVINNTDTIYTQNVSYTFASPGFYSVCQLISTGNNCFDTTCQTIEVIPAEVIAPNVITPNGDGINDLLVFQFLEYYPNNTLSVYNRWGNLIFEKGSYANDWNGMQYSDGTYYYVLSIESQQEPLRGFFELIK